MGVFIDSVKAVSKPILSTHVTTTIAELTALAEGIRTVTPWLTDPRYRVRVFTDSKAAINAVAWPRRNHNQTQAIKVINAAGDLPIIIHWVPGHSNICGNVEADGLAKDAAQPIGSNLSTTLVSP